MQYVLDTHPLVFLMYDPRQLSARVRTLVADVDTELLVPSMAVLEVQYLMEIGRVEGRAADIVDYIEQTAHVRLLAFAEMELREALGLVETRDPFDRAILASARCRSLPLITRDRWMKSVYSRTVWN